LVAFVVLLLKDPPRAMNDGEEVRERNRLRRERESWSGRDMRAEEREGGER
jgi:hypothetical protein